ncbi:hypothetical protein O9K51_11389 [Purpureocillium lavendulum]|uniref:Uncharacterized protein n=1 Tax=Purpureocillium lavendulum TaxID=1247861 RepID=A0AB34FCA2_9HYPO|nr:hypothetical protein O9K51_11389 [Purpureocillium lavendulum]
MVRTTRNSGSRKRTIDDRGKLRRRCRQLLADHIEQRTGWAIEPAKVRLVPTDKEWYSWSFRPAAAHLFSKNLSDHNAVAYNELCTGVGVTFEAVPLPFITDAGAASPCPDSGAQLDEAPPRQQRQSSAETPEPGETSMAGGESGALLQRVRRLQELVDAADVGKRLLEQELEAVRVECARLGEERRGTTERAIAREILLCKCLDVLNAIPTSVAELKDEISEALGRNAFGTG